MNQIATCFYCITDGKWPIVTLEAVDGLGLAISNPMRTDKARWRGRGRRKLVQSLDQSGQLLRLEIVRVNGEEVLLKKGLGRQGNKSSNG